VGTGFRKKIMLQVGESTQARTDFPLPRGEKMRTSSMSLVEVN
jgi:hypothetical protein